MKFNCFTNIANKNKVPSSRAFTLIELLVVIAIISILSTISIANMLESSIRAKVARTKNDMRVVATALEAYNVDYNAYVYFVRSGSEHLHNRVILPMTIRLSPLTTPITYISTVPIDIFETVVTTDGSPLIFFDTYDYADVASFKKSGWAHKGAGATSGGMWRLSSAGPDRIQAYGGDLASLGETSDSNKFGVDYDPTNGTISAGDIVRVGPPSSWGVLPGIRRAGGSYEELFRNPPAQ
jgi:prepilin-type N-terminal cleavage/methylation domain-containing protein